MKPFVPTEGYEQECLVQWLESHSYKFCSFSADPNTSPQRRAKRQRLGLRAGFPDMLIVLKNGDLLFLELKRVKGGVVSKEQKEWLAAIRASGNHAEVCKGFEAAKSLVLMLDSQPAQVKLL